ncbi:MAG: uroporphyrinogen decarboxylase, partial [Myxococcota bacterium]|nr:uroporphyrinogen decarboxylase [Myxococcota bacterium]
MAVFLDALARKPTPYTPIWLMRQAGRYQPSYRAIRAKVSFLELCKTPELACQVTVDAVDQLGVDAAIIFADILLLLEPLNVGFSFEKDHGPKIHAPVRDAATVDAMPTEIDAASSLGYVMDAIRLARRALSVPLIGFAAAPFTLASYAVEGGGSKSWNETKAFMVKD